MRILEHALTALARRCVDRLVLLAVSRGDVHRANHLILARVVAGCSGQDCSLHRRPLTRADIEAAR